MFQSVSDNMNGWVYTKMVPDGSTYGLFKHPYLEAATPILRVYVILVFGFKKDFSAFHGLRWMVGHFLPLAGSYTCMLL